MPICSKNLEDNLIKDGVVKKAMMMNGILLSIGQYRTAKEKVQGLIVVG